jgi:hypothetical protein
MQPDKTWCYCKCAWEEINTHKLDAIANIILSKTYLHEIWQQKNKHMKFRVLKLKNVEILL